MSKSKTHIKRRKLSKKKSFIIQYREIIKISKALNLGTAISKAKILVDYQLGEFNIKSLKRVLANTNRSEYKLVFNV